MRSNGKGELFGNLSPQMGVPFYGLHKSQYILRGSCGLEACVYPGASHLDISKVKRLSGVSRDGKERRDHA